MPQHPWDIFKLGLKLILKSQRPGLQYEGSIYIFVLQWLWLIFCLFTSFFRKKTLITFQGGRWIFKKLKLWLWTMKLCHIPSYGQEVPDLNPGWAPTWSSSWAMTYNGGRQKNWAKNYTNFVHMSMLSLCQQLDEFLKVKASVTRAERDPWPTGNVFYTEIKHVKVEKDLLQFLTKF